MCMIDTLASSVKPIQKERFSHAMVHFPLLERLMVILDILSGSRLNIVENKFVDIVIIATFSQLFLVSVFHHVSDTYNIRLGLKYTWKSLPLDKFRMLLALIWISFY